MKIYCDKCKCKKTNREAIIFRLKLECMDMTAGIGDFGISPLENQYRKNFSKLSSDGLDLCFDHFLELVSNQE